MSPAPAGRISSRKACLVKDDTAIAPTKDGTKEVVKDAIEEQQAIYKYLNIWHKNID